MKVFRPPLPIPELIYLVRDEGFEPSLHAPKARVLPLNTNL